MNTDTIGQLIQFLLYHLKSIEIRMDWSTCQFRGNDKYKINQSILKVKRSIDEISYLCKNRETIALIKKELEKVDLVYYMALTEQLFNLKEEDLREITDLIDDHLKSKCNINYELELKEVV